jgi:putative addiction module component (TIGR02574 family)
MFSIQFFSFTWKAIKMISIDEILKLSPAERILLVEKVWDSLKPNDIDVPTSHMAETRRRLEAIRRGEVSLSDWEEVRKRIRRDPELWSERRKKF